MTYSFNSEQSPPRSPSPFTVAAENFATQFELQTSDTEERTATIANFFSHGFSPLTNQPPSYSPEVNRQYPSFFHLNLTPPPCLELPTQIQIATNAQRTGVAASAGLTPAGVSPSRSNPMPSPYGNYLASSIEIPSTTTEQRTKAAANASLTSGRVSPSVSPTFCLAPQSPALKPITKPESSMVKIPQQPSSLNPQSAPLTLALDKAQIESYYNRISDFHRLSRRSGNSDWCQLMYQRSPLEASEEGRFDLSQTARGSGLSREFPIILKKGELVFASSNWLTLPMEPFSNSKEIVNREDGTKQFQTTAEAVASLGALKLKTKKRNLTEPATSIKKTKNSPPLETARLSPKNFPPSHPLTNNDAQEIFPSALNAAPYAPQNSSSSQPLITNNPQHLSSLPLNTAPYAPPNFYSSQPFMVNNPQHFFSPFVNPTPYAPPNFYSSQPFMTDNPQFLPSSLHVATDPNQQHYSLQPTINNSAEFFPSSVYNQQPFAQTILPPYQPPQNSSQSTFAPFVPQQWMNSQPQPENPQLQPAFLPPS